MLLSHLLLLFLIIHLLLLKFLFLLLLLNWLLVLLMLLLLIFLLSQILCFCSYSFSCCCCCSSYTVLLILYITLVLLLFLLFLLLLLPLLLLRLLLILLPAMLLFLSITAPTVVRDLLLPLLLLFHSCSYTVYTPLSSSNSVLSSSFATICTFFSCVLPIRSIPHFCCIFLVVFLYIRISPSWQCTIVRRTFFYSHCCCSNPQGDRPKMEPKPTSRQAGVYSLNYATPILDTLLLILATPHHLNYTIPILATPHPT
jgi:hypothetical protein